VKGGKQRQRRGPPGEGATTRRASQEGRGEEESMNPYSSFTGKKEVEGLREGETSGAEG